jgi:predicted cupin superfamily sugar epimerase
MKTTAEYWIEKLHLQPHPEGGYYRETFVGSDMIKAEGLPIKYGGPRKTYTVIYYLLQNDQISHFHRLKSDEIFVFYDGCPLILHLIDESGCYRQEGLGHDENGEISFHRVIKAGTWFGAAVSDAAGFSLVGCMVAPGFEFDDFELGKRQELLTRYPQHEEIIKKLTVA